MKPPRELTAGGPRPGASWYNALLKYVSRVAIVATPPLELVEHNGKWCLRLSKPQRIVIRISGGPTGLYYPWTEQTPSGSGWTDAANPLTGTASAAGDGAIEYNGNALVPLNKVVEAVRQVDGSLRFPFGECP